MRGIDKDIIYFLESQVITFGINMQNTSLQVFQLPMIDTGAEAHRMIIVLVVWFVGCRLLVRVLKTARWLGLAINALSRLSFCLVQTVQRELLVDVPKAECSSISLDAIVNMPLLLGPLQLLVLPFVDKAQSQSQQGHHHANTGISSAPGHVLRLVRGWIHISPIDGSTVSKSVAYSNGR